MGKKAEAGTPKAISNAMKVKGLQKLRFFCQLCQKQCRDENGFKCHTMSEGHQRQMMLCADDPSHMLKVTSEFSADFLGGFLRILRLSYNGKRVKANTVYQDYISDRNHTHMNATRWHTLSGFVQWLGKTGYCKVDFVEEKNQWYIEYVDNSPETLQRNAEKEKLAKHRKDDAEREAATIQAKKSKKEPVKWIYKKIVVKVMNKKLGEKFYKKKAFIESTDGFVAVVQVIDSGKRAKIDQDDLETVIPSAGRQVVILVGEKRGHIGELVKLDADNFAAVVELDEEKRSYPYEHISKLYQKS